MASNQKLSDTLTFKVGPAIAKCLLAICFKDIGLASEAGTDLLDLLHERTDNARVKQQTSRLFLEIGEQVAESLIPAFEFESPNLDEGSRSAVALAIADTINKANIDVATLAAVSLDPNELMKQLSATNKYVTAHFEDTLKQLYTQILQQCCYNIISAASTLPDFNGKNFAELFKRSNKIQDSINKVLDEIVHIQNDVKRLNQNPDFARFERDYSNAVLNKLGRLELFGVDASITSQRYSLDTAYTTLRANWAVGKNIVSGRNEQITKALSETRHLFVRGDPGSGKTTLLQWVAVRAATRTFPDEMSSWNDSVPLFVKLRQYANQELPTPREFIRALTPALSDRTPVEWLEEILMFGRAIILVDGVDELSKDKQYAVLNWLQDLITVYPEVRVLVTTRPYAVGQGWIEQHGFDCIDLLQMEDSIMEEFISRWHKAVGDEITQEEEKMELEEYESSIQNAVKNDRQFRELATNPLLCAMLCALNRQRQRDLPSQRVSLYEAACRMLLESREKRKGVKSDNYPKMLYEELMIILQELAFWMFSNGYKQTTKEAVERLINSIRPSLMRLDAKIKTEDVYGFLVQRSGLVRELQVGQLDFVHLTFQEFLAARCAIEKDSIGFLIRASHDPQWREVVVLAASLASETARFQLISGIQVEAKNSTSDKFALYLVSIACANSVIKLDTKLKSAINESVKSLPPPKDKQEAKSWAQVGQLAINFLTVNYIVGRMVETRYQEIINSEKKKGKKIDRIEKPKLSLQDIDENVVVSCVCALGLIGGDKAMDALQSYTVDGRVGVGAELGRNWRAFVRYSYLERVLSKCKTLTLNQMPYPSEILRLKSLTKLEIENCKELTNLKQLSGLVSLEELIVVGCFNLIDVSGLEDSDVKSIQIKYCANIRSLTPLSLLPKLSDLDLFHCEGVTSLSPLVASQSLKNIRYGGWYPDKGKLGSRKDINIYNDKSITWLLK